MTSPSDSRRSFPESVQAIGAWQPVGADILVNVLCFDPTGNPAPANALITVTNRG